MSGCEGPSISVLCSVANRVARETKSSYLILSGRASEVGETAPRLHSVPRRGARLDVCGRDDLPRVFLEVGRGCRASVFSWCSPRIFLEVEGGYAGVVAAVVVLEAW